MDTCLLLRLGRWTVPVPAPVWQRQVDSDARKRRESLALLTPDHHRVRDLAVLGLPQIGAPLAPGWFAEKLGLPLAETVAILDDLEAGMVFLFRNEAGEVTWAYPVTVDDTPHAMTFSTGERINAA